MDPSYVFLQITPSHARRTEDCTWMDPDLICQDYEMDFSMDRGWFGGDYLAIIGECECR